MTQFRQDRADLRERLVSTVLALDEDKLERAAELLSPLVGPAGDLKEQEDFDAEAWLRSIGLSVEEFLAIAEEGHASIQRGEGMTLEDILAKHREAYPEV